MTWRFWRRADVVSISGKTHTDTMTLAEQRQALAELLERDVENHPQYRPRYRKGMERPDPRKFAPMNIVKASRFRPHRWSA